MKVKICGIMDVETALYAVKHGADALGFVFAESKRKISSEEVKKIIEQLPKDVLKVGVFVNEKAGNIEQIVADTGLTTVQLHGDETPEFGQSISVPIIKALSVSKEEDLALIHQYSSDYVLLDSPKGKYRGGNGVSFDWSLLETFNFGSKKVILAGGLNEGNVEEAIKLAKPYMVDVSSGVETNGKKDFAKIKGFIERAKSREEVR